MRGLGPENIVSLSRGWDLSVNFCGEVLSVLKKYAIPDSKHVIEFPTELDFRPREQECPSCPSLHP